MSPTLFGMAVQALTTAFLGSIHASWLTPGQQLIAGMLLLLTAWLYVAIPRWWRQP
jgi:hypothetical protein